MTKTSKSVAILYIIGRQLSLFVPVVLLTSVVAQWLLRSPVPNSSPFSLYGDLYPLFVSSVIIHATLRYYAPHDLRTNNQLLRHGGKIVSTVFLAISGLLVTLWLNLACATLFIVHFGGLLNTLAGVCFFGGNLLASVCLVRHFSHGLVAATDDRSMSDRFFDSVHYYVTRWQRLSHSAHPSIQPDNRQS